MRLQFCTILANKLKYKLNFPWDNNLESQKNEKLHLLLIFSFCFTDIQSIRGLAVDWVSRNLYWISSEFDETQINVARLDGSLKTSVIHGIDKPQCLAAHPVRG